VDNRVAKLVSVRECGFFEEILNFLFKIPLGFLKSVDSTIKVQRVDGCWLVGGASCLRCTLMGFEKNYQTKIPSKQINKVRFYSSDNGNLRLTMNP
jgi:hypothetical protein